MARRTEKGQLIIELLIAFGLSSILFPALLTGFISGTRGREVYEQRLRAMALMREGEEVVRMVREKSWNAFAVNGTFYPKVEGGEWTLSTLSGDGTVNGFTRTVEISDVTPIDPSKKQAEITVSWPGLFIRSVSSKLIVTRWANAVESLTAEGELTQQGFGDWCNPSESITTVDLSRQGVPTAVWAFEMGGGAGNRVFAGTGENASGPGFTNTKIEGNDPPVATPVGDFNGSPQVKVNGVYGDGNYAYLTTDRTNAEVLILDLNQFSGPSEYQDVGYFNSPGSVNGISVASSGTVGYMTAGSNFYAFDLTTKTGSRPQIGSAVTLAGNGVKIYIVGSFAYVVISGSETKIQIVNLSSMTIAGSVTLTAGNGRDVYINSDGTRAYLVTSASASQPEFFIVDTTDKGNPSVVTGGTFDASGMDPKGVTVVPGGYRAIVVGSEGPIQYLVIDITDEGSLTSCGPGLAINGGANAISSLLQTDGHAYSYIVTGDANNELKIVEGGPGGIGGGGGTFESPVFDVGEQVIFNYFNVDSVSPEGVVATFKIAVSADCTTFNYVGSDGTPGGAPYGNSGGPIPVSLSPGRCFKYQATFTGGGEGVTDASANTTVNYSP